MAIKKANRILGLIKKSSINLDTKSLPLIIQILSEATFGVWQYYLGSALQRRPESPRKSFKKSHKSNTKYPKFTIQKTITPT